MSMEVGSTVKGTVLRVADYGAIVRLASGQTGLIHISEIADAYVRDVREYLNESDEVSVKVLRLNSKGRYELSLRQSDSAVPPQSPPDDERVEPARRRPERWEDRNPDSSATAKRSGSFEDRLTRFMKDSEDRLHDLKRHLDSKRGR